MQFIYPLFFSFISNNMIKYLILYFWVIRGKNSMEVANLGLKKWLLQNIWAVDVIFFIFWILKKNKTIWHRNFKPNSDGLKLESLKASNQVTFGSLTKCVQHDLNFIFIKMSIKNKGYVILDTFQLTQEMKVFQNTSSTQYKRTLKKNSDNKTRFYWKTRVHKNT